ncbi:MAG: PQQ-binding-like beta-propeller repeat protein [bacterium]
MRSRSLFLLTGMLVLAALLAGCPSPPAAPDKPWGPTSAARNAFTSCSTRVADAGAGDVAYQFDWGDGVQSAWSALQPAGVAFGDTHTYTLTGNLEVRARAKTARSGASDWSEPLFLRVEVGEGELSRRFGFADPEDPEDSADFSINTFALGPDGRSYVGCEWALLFRRADGIRDKEFYTEDLDEFLAAPSLSDAGVLHIACANETLYAFNADGTRRWAWACGDEVTATTALGADGTVYLHTASESLFAVSAVGARHWSFPSSGNSSPVVGADGTVYAANQEGRIFALDPSSGTEKAQYGLSSEAIDASPALDPGRNRLYVGDEAGNFVALNLQSFTPDWELASIGEAPSSAVVGADGTVFVGAGGRLLALDHSTGATCWTFQPPLAGAVSTPALSDQGLVYVAVTSGRKDADGVDSLYAVNAANGARRWAIGLDYGFWEGFSSAPKIDDRGYVYVGNGLYAWIIRGLGGPAPSPWPMFQRDGANSGRARN